MDVDLPKSTVFVLLVLTMVITAFGTWTVLDSFNNAQKAPPVKKEEAKIALIIQPPDSIPAQTNNEPFPATGMVTLQIKK